MMADQDTDLWLQQNVISHYIFIFLSRIVIFGHPISPWALKFQVLDIQAALIWFPNRGMGLKLNIDCLLPQGLCHYCTCRSPLLTEGLYLDWCSSFSLEPSVFRRFCFLSVLHPIWFLYFLAPLLQSLIESTVPFVA